MNCFFGYKKIKGFLIILMVMVQLFALNGCVATEHIPVAFEPIIDNDLVKEAVYDKITFKVGESWAPVNGKSGMYFYPGTTILYYVSCSGSFNDFVNEENYFDYVIQYLRDSDVANNVTVTS